MTEITVTAIIGWVIALCGLVFSFYTIIKNNAKSNKEDVMKAKEDNVKCSIETNTVLVRLDGIQSSIDKLYGSMTSMQSKVEAIDHRLTVAETKLALGVADGKNLGL